MNSFRLVGISIFIVLIFMLQPVGAINYELEAYTDKNPTMVSTNSDRVAGPGPGSENDLLEPLDVMRVTKEPLSFFEQIEETRRLVSMMDPNIPAPDYEFEDIISKNEPVMTDRVLRQPSGMELSDHHKMKIERFAPQNIKKPSSDSLRETRKSAAADLEITHLEWQSKANAAWGSYTEDVDTPGNNPQIGGFMVGLKTRITVTVINHNPTTPVSNIKMNFSIIDYYSGKPLIKIPKSVVFSIVGATTTVTLDFTPPAAKSLRIAAYIDYPKDTDPSNNGISYHPITVLIWSSDFEASGFGDGSQTPNTWGGDLGTGDDEWHKTSSAANQNDQNHTSSNSFYHGNESGAPDVYNDSLNLYLESPRINMGQISDGQAEAGTLPDGSYYPFAVPTWAGLFTGEAEIPSGGGTPDDTDILWAYEYTDDDGLNWKEPISKFGYGGFVVDNWEQIFSHQQDPTWNPNIWHISQTEAMYGWPFALMLGDGTGGVKSHNGVMNWTKVKFRVQMDGDSEDDSGMLPGFYADDFVTWGYQKWLPPYYIRISEVTTLQANNTPILYPNVGTNFKVSVVNRGEPLTNVPVKIEVKNAKTGANVFGPHTKTIASIADDTEVTLTFAGWTPTAEGDYLVSVVAGDLTQDYTPLLNTWELSVHVRKPGGQVLVVDDDNSKLNGGETLGRNPTLIDIEDRMLDALDDIGLTYNVFTVESNGTGPSKDVMNNFEAVIWLTGFDNEYSQFNSNPQFGTGNWGITLKPEDQIQLANWLNEGDKNFWMISPGVLYDLTNTEGAASPTGFLKDYLHVIYCNANETKYDSDGKITVPGTPVHLVGEGGSLATNMNYETYGADIPEPLIDIGGIIDVDPNSDYVFYQNTARTAVNSIQYSKNYDLVYFAFNFYLIKDPKDRRELAYRVMHFFGILGKVELELVDEISKPITFGETVSFKYKVINNGLAPEVVSIELTNPSPNNIPNGWSVRLNNKMPDVLANEFELAPDGGTAVFYLNVTAPNYYLDNNGNLDPSIKNSTSGSEIQFKIRVQCKSYPENFFDQGSCKVIMEADGYVRISTESAYAELDFSTTTFPEDMYAEFKILLRHVTNSDADTMVLVTLDNPTELDSDVYQGSAIITDVHVTLIPRMDAEVDVRVFADEHTQYGEYDIDFKVMDEAGNSVLAQATLTTSIKQFYDIRLVPLETMSYSRIVDPNAMNSDEQVEEFELILENHGNGPDTVTIEWRENRDSPNWMPIEWVNEFLFVYDKSGGSEPIDEITIPGYNELINMPSSASLIVKITVPKEEQEGRFWTDIKVISSAPREFENNMVRDDIVLVDNYTMQITMVLPELSFDTDESTLRFKDGSKIPDYATTLYEGEPIFVSPVMINLGAGGVHDVEVELLVTLDNVNLFSDLETISIGGGEYRNLSFSVLLEYKGVYQIKVRIDPQYTIFGDEPNDNTWIRYFKINDIKSRPPDPPPEPPVGGDLNRTNPDDPESWGDWFNNDIMSAPAGFAVAITIFLIILIIVFILLFFMVLKPKWERDAMIAVSEDDDLPAPFVDEVNFFDPIEPPPTDYQSEGPGYSVSWTEPTQPLYGGSNIRGRGSEPPPPPDYREPDLYSMDNDPSPHRKPHASHRIDPSNSYSPDPYHRDTYPQYIDPSDMHVEPPSVHHEPSSHRKSHTSLRYRSSYRDISDPLEVTYETRPREDMAAAAAKATLRASEPAMFDAGVECPSCGEENPPQIRACGSCGKELYFYK